MTRYPTNILRLWEHPRAKYVKSLLDSNFFKVSFNMGAWGHWCQKPTCIASNRFCSLKFAYCFVLLVSPYCIRLSFIAGRLSVSQLYRKLTRERRQQMEQRALSPACQTYKSLEKRYVLACDQTCATLHSNGKAKDLGKVKTTVIYFDKHGKKKVKGSSSLKGSQLLNCH